MTLWDLFRFSVAIREHIGPKYRDFWDDMEAAYFAATEGQDRSQFAFWLMQTAGSNKQYTAKVLDVALREDPSNIWDFTAWLITKIDQKQWNSLAPSLSDDSLVDQNVNLIRRKKKQIERRGVKPWIPGIEL